MDIIPLGVRKGAWTEQEDILLKKFIIQNGEGKWHLVPSKAGLNRCRKSCRLRWLNYLRPNIKRGEFAIDEIDLIMRLHKLLGNRWSLIAGRIPGRTANDVKNYWNTYLRKKIASHHDKTKPPKNSTETKVIKPQPRTFSKSSLLQLREKYALQTQTQHNNNNNNNNNNKSFEIQGNQNTTASPPLTLPNEEHHNDRDDQWWDSLMVESDGFENIETCFASMEWLNDDPIIGHVHEELVAVRIVEGTACDVTGKSGTVDLYSTTNESSLGVDIWNLLDLKNDLVI